MIKYQGWLLAPSSGGEGWGEARKGNFTLFEFLPLPPPKGDKQPTTLFVTDFVLRPTAN